MLPRIIIIIKNYEQGPWRSALTFCDIKAPLLLFWLLCFHTHAARDWKCKERDDDNCVSHRPWISGLTRQNFALLCTFTSLKGQQLGGTVCSLQKGGNFVWGCLGTMRVCARPQLICNLVAESNSSYTQGQSFEGRTDIYLLSLYPVPSQEPDETYNKNSKTNPENKLTIVKMLESKLSHLDTKFI